MPSVWTGESRTVVQMRGGEGLTMQLQAYRCAYSGRGSLKLMSGKGGEEVISFRGDWGGGQILRLKESV